MTCELCDTIDWQDGETHRIVECNTCHIPMLVLKEHRQFTEFEKELIELLCEHRKEILELYDEYNIKKQGRWCKMGKPRFEQRKIKSHAHCHFE